MSLKNKYLDVFFRDGKIVVDEGTPKEKKKLFKSILRVLYMEHPEFVERCTTNRILKIDDVNYSIELLL